MLILLLYFILLSCVFAIAYRKGTLFFALFFVLLSTSDFILIQSGASSSELILAKFWKEILFLTLFSYWFLYFIKTSGKTERWLIAFILLAVISSASALAVGFTINASEAIVAWRRFYLPMTIPMLAYASHRFAHIEISRLIYLFISFGTVMSIYAANTYLTFDGDYTNVWYYEFITEAKLSSGEAIHRIQHQIIRNNQLRASGFFVSPIDFSIYLSTLTALNCACIYFYKGLERNLFILALPVLVFALYTSNVRAGFIFLIIALASFLLLTIINRRYSYLLLVIPAVATAGTFTALMFSIQIDDSAFGRLEQYEELIAKFRIFGYGLVATDINSITYRDSWYISILGIFGVFSVFYIAACALPFTLVRDTIINRLELYSPSEKALSFMVLITGVALVYQFAFHFTAGSPVLQFTYLAIFALLINSKKLRKFKKAIHHQNLYDK